MNYQRFGVVALSAFLWSVVLASPGLAYIGPGTGIAAIGAFLALIAAVFFAIVGFLWFPIKRMLKKRKQAEAQSDEAGDET
ncbi:MAG: hypothetical protein AAGG02_16155 [Cyanobacteria bacterium P01_H01_bin.15]